MAPIVDLHVHSSYSDGFWRPSEVVRKAKGVGLRQISISDHNTVLSQKEAQAASVQGGLDYVNGVEIDSYTEFEGLPLNSHILGYCYDTEILGHLLDKIVLRNNKHFVKMIERLRALCASQPAEHNMLQFKRSIDPETINVFSIIKDEYSMVYLKSISDEDVNRLLKERFFPAEIIARFIKNHLLENPENLTERDPRFWASNIVFKGFPEVFGSHGSWFPSQRRVISEIKKAGGVSCIAHPFLRYASFNESAQVKYDRFLGKLIGAGLCGMESYFYRGQGLSEQQETALNYKTKNLVAAHNLIMTFGSDCHGPKRGNESKVYLGRFGGESLIKVK